VQNRTCMIWYIGTPFAILTAGDCLKIMNRNKITILAATTLLSTFAASAAVNPGKVDDRLAAASTVLGEMMRADDKGVPQDLLNSAHCVVIIPGVKKAGFIVGAKYGKGFAVCHKPSGHGWNAPAAIRVEGGSFGFQIGASETDAILIIQNQSGMKKLLESKFTLGADASVAGGPVGRDLSAETDAQMHAEILSYSRSRGLFAGLALSGATLRPDDDDNIAMYGPGTTNRMILEGDVKPTAAAMPLLHRLDKYADRRDK
jgi:lipid-binding SYLF domain-containing protein